MMGILATSKIYGNYQTSIPREFRKMFNVDKDSILEWGGKWKRRTYYKF